ncbi:MAG: NAD(P)-binding domain-containing protein, partial [Betaproteobacteria bacterium]|nr:NAD(P)-binding domain-containing protein [Betaproteobacteria bacterium]
MNITFIGGGNIASAIIGGLVRQSFDARLVRVVEIDPGLRAQLAQRFGVAAFADTGQLPVTGDVVVMAVKPQQMRTAAGPLAPRLRQELVLSVAAGIRIADLARWLGGYGRIVRCMPNTPALIGAGITAAYAAPAVTPGER